MLCNAGFLISPRPASILGSNTQELFHERIPDCAQRILWPHLSGAALSQPMLPWPMPASSGLATAGPLLMRISAHPARHSPRRKTSAIFTALEPEECGLDTWLIPFLRLLTSRMQAMSAEID